MRRSRSDLCQCLLQTAIRSSAFSTPIERRTWPSQILEAYLPRRHVEVTPGRRVPDKISIVCLTGAAHYILSSNMPQVFDLLLKYGLDPNAVCEGETVLSCVSSVYNEYIAADTMVLLMEHGGNPNLVVSGERLFHNKPVRPCRKNIVPCRCFCCVRSLPFRARALQKPPVS